MATSYAAAGKQLDAILDDPQARTLVAKFYDRNGPFAGDTFDALNPNSPNSIDHVDLLAITLLDVRVRPLAVRQLLEDRQTRSTLLSLLRRIPADVDLWDAECRILDTASEVWTLLDKLPGIGPVIAGKLLARKRPRLIPVVDSVTARALAAPKGEVWNAIRECLADDSRLRTVRLLRPVDISQHVVSDLRILDSLLWMRYSESANARRVKRGLGYPGMERR